MSNLTLWAGDRIVVPKSGFRLAQHHAIYDGNGFFYENKVFKGVVRTPMADFFKDVLEITEIRRFTGNEYQRQSAMQRAKSLLGKGYDLPTFNCEHYADYVQNGHPRSRQVENVIGIGAVALLMVVVARATL